ERATRTGSVGGGREAHAVVELPSGEKAVVRRYRRGGLVRHLNRGLYFGGNRAFDELRATERARAGGVRVPTVIAAVERPAWIGYRALLATLLIPDGRDGAAWLADAGEEARLRMLREAGAQVAAMHAAGVAHSDLNLRNLLVAPGEDRVDAVYVLDFDKAAVGTAPVATARRTSDLRRLERSARKLGAPISAEGWAALRKGYGPEWPEGLELGVKVGDAEE
ncbi:MAG TPA: lipopolysaccharide kinase InaA family protein, partial [Longimicrobiaceae bacterium]|nr:lipopolysaccharide kinase InaA family protein [Longimicrobiaceae bacterium]